MTQEHDPSLDALVAPGKPVDIAGESWTITPLKVAQLPAFLRAAQPVFDELQNGDITAALMREADSAIEAIAIASGRPRKWVDALGIDELVELGGVCMELNVDFFVRKVLPKFQASARRINALSTGSMSPADSSLTATVTAK